ncbi:hypothetical protein [Paenibacillus amylolyticus]|uniref:hypothetical protein n=1 Tax=Paenibacillus amylolyticus TaxID=1451 RepID=UPI0033943434
MIISRIRVASLLKWIQIPFCPVSSYRITRNIATSVDAAEPDFEIAMTFMPTEKKPQQAAKAIKGGALLRNRPQLSFDPVQAMSTEADSRAG